VRSVYSCRGGDRYMRIAPAIELSPDERRTLERLARGHRTEVRLVERARMILLAGDGRLNKDIAVELGTTAKRVGLWRMRYSQQRLAGIEKDRPRGGRPPRAHETGSVDHQEDHASDSAQRDALEHSLACETPRHVQVTCSARLEGQQSQATSCSHLQGQQRPGVRGQVGRHRRFVSGPTRQRAGSETSRLPLAGPSAWRVAVRSSARSRGRRSRPR